MGNWEGQERRQHTRVGVNGEVSGRIQTASDAPVVDISASGALLELPCALQSDSIYQLRLSGTEDSALEIKGRVVRSYVHGFAKDSEGGTRIMYRAAIHFIDMDDAQKSELEQLVAKGGKGLSAELS